MAVQSPLKTEMSSPHFINMDLCFLFVSSSKVMPALGKDSINFWMKTLEKNYIKLGCSTIRCPTLVRVLFFVISAGGEIRQPTFRAGMPAKIAFQG